MLLLHDEDEHESEEEGGEDEGGHVPSVGAGSSNP